MQRSVEIFARRRQLHAFPRKGAQILEPSARGEEGITTQNLRRIECDRVAEERFLQARSRLHGNTSQAWFVDGVPVFQRCFEIALQKVDGAQEIQRVGVLRIEAQSGAQILLGRRKILLLVIDAGQLHQESQIARILEVPGDEGSARFIPLLLPGKR
jgi:hypothetical protein